MTRARICLITAMHPSANPRLVKEADALAEAGYAVDVIAAVHSSRRRVADKEFDDRPWKIVARLQYGPESPRGVRFLELSRRLVAGIATRNLGLRNGALVRAAWHPAGPALVANAKKTKADLYIAHTLAALPAAAIAAQKHDALWAFDAEDYHFGEIEGGRSFDYARSLVREIENRYLGGCAYITAASPMIAAAYAASYEIPEPEVILNVFPLSLASPVVTVMGTARPRPSVYWFSQTIGPGRGLECALRAISLAQSAPHLYLRGNVAADYRVHLEHVAAEAGVADRLHILPVAPPSQMEQLASAYDVGLSGEPGSTQNNQILLANKLFTYFLAGLPIAMSATPANTAFAPQLGGAARLYAPEDPASLASALDYWFEDDDRLANARHAAWELGQRKFNWDSVKSVFLKTVANALARSN